MKVLIKYSLLAVVLLSLQASAKYRSDVLIPGTKDNPKGFYLFAGQDFNQMFGLQPGDTVGLRSGYYGDINLSQGLVGGITFMVDPENRDTVFMKWFGLGNNAQDCRLWGKSKYLDYGLKISDPAHFGLSWTCTGKMEAAWFISDNNRIGVQLINVKGQSYVKNEQDLYLHDVIISNPLGEALYTGYVNDAAFPAKVKLERVKVIEAGWDGLQFKSCSSIEVYDCTIDGAGLAKEYGQDHGIIIGQNTNGAIIKNTTVKGVNGFGLWIGGWGTFDVECNSIEGNAGAIISRNSFPESDQQNIGYQKMIFRDNSLTGLSGKLMQANYENNGKPVTIEAYNNRSVGTWNIATGISFISVNNNPLITPSCGSIIPLPVEEDESKPPHKPKPNKGKYKVYNLAAAYLGNDKKNLNRGWYILKYEDGTTEFLRVEK